MNRFLLNSLWSVNFVLSLALALAIGSHISHIFWQLNQDPRLNRHILVPTLLVNASNQTHYDWRVLLQQHWFGNTQALKQKNKPKAVVMNQRDNAPETDLKLYLKGTLYSSNPKLATALIAGPDGKVKLYRPEKTLPSGIILESVHPNKVILRRQQGHNQQYEVLKMETKTKGKNQSSFNRQPVMPLRDIRAKILKDPNTLTQWLKLRPANKGGQFLGYRINAGRDKSLLAQLELKSGDVITRINGIALTGNIQSLQALQKLQTAKQLQIDLVRDGQPLARSFQF